MKHFILGLLSLSTLASVSNTASLTSNYVWRGQTQSNKSAAAQGSLDWAHKSGLNSSVWVSNLSAGNGAEVDLSLGYGMTFGKVSVSAGVLHYHYVQGGSSDTTEYNLGVEAAGYAFSVNYTDDFFGTDSSSIYLNLSKSFGISKMHNLALNLSLGYTSHDEEEKTAVASYMDYKIGLEKSYKTASVELWLTDTDRETIANEVNTEVEDKAVGFTVNFNL